jgi:cyanophycinase-like exopeptidase
VPIALHGGGEFLPGDEVFLDALLQTARRAAAGRHGDISELIRVVVVPTAAARGRPDLAASNGVNALQRRGGAAGLPIWADVADIVDEASADDPALAELVSAADLVYLPGGDPDLIPTIMPGSAAWAAITEAHLGGSVLAGASAGAMALGPWTWTPGGGMGGLHLVQGYVVVPHAHEENWAATIERFAAWAPEGLGALGLSEQTGVVEEPTRRGRLTIGWRVVGPGVALWLADPEHGGQTVVARAGNIISTPVIAL